MLFEHLLGNAFFACLLQGKSHCTFKLKTPSHVVNPKPLSEKKIASTNSVWSMMDGLLTKLWKANPDGSLKLPIGIPSLVPYHII
jgi:hypothetical protein